jgi:hypothetical protein
MIDWIDHNAHFNVSEIGIDTVANSTLRAGLPLPRPHHLDRAAAFATLERPAQDRLIAVR